MINDKSTIERAIELARAGTCRTMDDLRGRLRHEQYENVTGHLMGTRIKKQLVELMQASSGKPQAV
jgi:hypothetical protein